jgi:hypothetical protein
MYVYIEIKHAEIEHLRANTCTKTSRDKIMASLGLLHLIGTRKGSHTNDQELQNLGFNRDTQEQLFYLVQMLLTK